MKFIIVDETTTDIFSEEFNDREEAIKAAGRHWESMTTYDQRRRVSFYVLESVNPDPEAENHFDGDIVKQYK